MELSSIEIWGNYIDQLVVKQLQPSENDFEIFITTVNNLIDQLRDLKIW